MSLKEPGMIASEKEADVKRVAEQLYARSRIG